MAAPSSTAGIPSSSRARRNSAGVTGPSSRSHSSMSCWSASLRSFAAAASASQDEIETPSRSAASRMAAPSSGANETENLSAVMPGYYRALASERRRCWHEIVARPPVARDVDHDYPDELPAPGRACSVSRLAPGPASTEEGLRRPTIANRRAIVRHRHDVMSLRAVVGSGVAGCSTAGLLSMWLRSSGAAPT